MKCDICKDEGKETREYINAKDYTGHLMGMHDKIDIARKFARELLKGEEA